MTDRRKVLALGAASFLLPTTVVLAEENCASPADSAANSVLLDRYTAAVNAHDTSSFADIFT